MTPSQFEIDRAAFLHKICENPFDPTLRLIFADYLEEWGNIDFAAFIRRMIVDGDQHAWERAKKYYDKPESLLPREILKDFYGWNIKTESYTLRRVEVHKNSAVLTNGFVSSIRIRYADFTRLASLLFARHPIIRVQIMDKEPYDNSLLNERTHPYFWLCFDKNSFPPWHLPKYLMDRMEGEFDSYFGLPQRGFEDKSEAVAALSRVCVDYGRVQAGLPALDWGSVRYSPLETERTTFLRRIFEEPFNIAPRLIFAEWLEANRSENIGLIQDIRDSNPTTFNRYLHIDGQIFPARLRNGLFFSVSISMNEFLEHARSLFEQNPITEIVMMEKQPLRVLESDLWIWDYQRAGIQNLLATAVISDKLYSRLVSQTPGNGKYFFSRNSAIQALSRACVDYGRELARLPKLDWEKVA